MHTINQLIFKAVVSLSFDNRLTRQINYPTPLAVPFQLPITLLSKGWQRKGLRPDEKIHSLSPWITDGWLPPTIKAGGHRVAPRNTMLSYATRTVDITKKAMCRCSRSHMHLLMGTALTTSAHSLTCTPSVCIASNPQKVYSQATSWEDL